MIKEFYNDKVMLITGTTGFLGKVVLEKIFRSLPRFKKIYLLVRPKSGVTIMERVKREIFQSQCFDLVRETIPNLNAFIEQRIVPIVGDITKENLMISAEDRKKIIDDVQVIINCAASVDFNERLCDALQINYFGAQRMQQLALECKKLEIFTHVSTCYVNCEKKGYIQEKIYDVKEDSEVIIDRIMKMTPEQQDAQLPQILGDWPNTYTFTKSMAERTLRKNRRANLPQVILRPSIIGGSYTEPYPGWTDTFSAAGGLSLAGSIGIINYVYGDGNNIADLIPVDFVSNAIIVATALQANKPSLNVLNVGTSHQNPITWTQYMDYGFDYINQQPFDKQIFPPHVRFIKNYKLLNFLFFFRSKLPAVLYEKFANLPIIGSAHNRKNAERLQKVNIRAWDLGMLFAHFTFNEWIYETNEIFRLIDQLSPEEREEFQFDVKTINWPFAVKAYIYGMQKFILKQDVVSPALYKTGLIPKVYNGFIDNIKWTYSVQPKLTKTSIKTFQIDVLNSNLVKNQIQNEMAKLNILGNSKEAAHQYDKIKQQAKQYLDEMQAQLRPSVIKTCLFLLNKVLQRVYDQLIVNEKEVNFVKELIEKQKDNVVLIPTHKSYVDFLIIEYIHYHYNIEMPFTCGPEDMLNIAIITYILKSGGGFFLNSQHLNSELFRAVLQAYTRALLQDNAVLQIFIEKQRSRSGKLQKPKQPLFDFVVKSWFNPLDTELGVQKDIKFVPITINYDRVYEGESFPLELLGEAKQKESLIRVMKSIGHIKKQLGRVSIKYCEPISLREYVTQYAVKNNQSSDFYSMNENAKDELIKSLGVELTYTLTENLVTMVTSLVASVLLQHRKGISEDEILKHTNWIYEEIQARGGELNLHTPPSSTSIQAALKFLEGFVVRKRNIFEPSVSAKKDYGKILMLAYYRNSLIHLFINDAIVACALLGIGAITELSKGVQFAQVYQKCQFLSDLLSEEFMVRKQMKNQDDFMKAIDFMGQRGFIGVDKQENLIKYDQKNNCQQTAQSFLCHLLLPFIESYWISLTYLVSLENKNLLLLEETLYSKIQWLAEILYDEGYFKFYESCSLESIKNAIHKFTMMGVLERKSSTHKGVETVVYSLKKEYQEQKNITELYENVIFFLSYQPTMNLPKMQSEIRRLFHSDLQLSPKL